MLQFIFTNILMIAVGVMLYLVIRALPRLDEEDAVARKNVFERLVASGIPEKLDAAFDAFSVKFLRKSKVYLLKIENKITGKLHKMKAETDLEAGKMLDFKDIHPGSKTPDAK